MTKYAILLIALANSAAAQIAEFPVDLRAAPVEPTIDQCRAALDQGRLLRADPDGTLTIYYSSTLYTIVLNDLGLRCKAIRHY